MTRHRFGAPLLALAVLFAVCGFAAAGEAKIGADGITITEGDTFSLNMHVLTQVDVVRSRQEAVWGGALFVWFNKLTLDRVPDNLPDRVATRIAPRVDFHVTRARIAFDGKAFVPWVNWKIEIEGNSSDPSPKVLDAYLRLGDAQRYSVVLGQFKTPFDLFRMTPEWKLGFRNISAAGLATAPKYAVGAMAEAHSLSGRVAARLALQNADNPAGGSPSRRIATTVRVEFQNEGGYDYDLTAVTRPSDFQYTIGAGWVRNVTTVGKDADTNRFCVSGISRCTGKLPSGTGAELFGAFRVSGLTVSTSWQRWTFENAEKYSNDRLPEKGVSIAANNLTVNKRDMAATTWQTEIAYSPWDQIEFVGRIGKVRTDDYGLEALPFGPHSLTPADILPWNESPAVLVARPNYVALREKIKDFGMGFNYYFKQQHAKFQFAWSKAKITDKVVDQYYSYVNDLETDANQTVHSIYDFVRRPGRIYRKDVSFSAMLTFYL